MLVCCKCEKKLEPVRTQFSYLGQTFSTEVQRCPSCGAAFIPEELARGRMAEVEMTLEDK
jgi:hypothetical protein